MHPDIKACIATAPQEYQTRLTNLAKLLLRELDNEKSYKCGWGTYEIHERGPDVGLWAYGDGFSCRVRERNQEEFIPSLLTVSPRFLRIPTIGIEKLESLLELHPRGEEWVEELQDQVAQRCHPNSYVHFIELDLSRDLIEHISNTVGVDFLVAYYLGD